jgi:hypothetical protein
MPILSRVEFSTMYIISLASRAFPIQHRLHYFAREGHDLQSYRYIRYRYAALAAEVCCEADAKNISCDHRIREAHDFAVHRDDIHQNPVRRQLVQNAKKYKYCSGFPDSGWIAGPQRLKPRERS